MRRLFNRRDDFARRAGQSRSAAKRRAARENGLKGGRRRTRTLAEYLLQRRIADYQRDCVTRAFDEVCNWLGRGHKVLRTYFGVWDVDEEEPSEGEDIPHTIHFTRPRGKIRQDVLLAVRLFRLLANSELKKLGAPKPPRDYVVVREPKDSSEQEAWELNHPEGPPCPRKPRKIYFKRTIAYQQLKLRLSHHPDDGIPSAAEIYEEFGGEVCEPKVQNAIVETLRFEFPREQRGIPASPKTTSHTAAPPAPKSKPKRKRDLPSHRDSEGEDAW